MGAFNLKGVDVRVHVISKRVSPGTNISVIFLKQIFKDPVKKLRPLALSPLLM